MKNAPFLRLAILAIMVVFVFPGMSSAQVLKGNEVEFTATVNSVLDNGGGEGTLFVLVSGTELKVLVNAGTEFQNGENEATLSDLKKDDVIRVTGKFSSGGILASSIEMLPSDAEFGFTISGHITGLQVGDANVLITLLGITVTADKTMTTTGDGTAVGVADLKPGTKVKIGGTISGSTWTASSIEALSSGKKKDTVRFEGTIESITDGMIQVKVDGTETIQPVIITSSTEICGTLAVGAVVEVKGKLNSDLQIEADKVCVIGALEIKPDHVKIETGATQTLTVKLREPATGPVTINLSVEPTGVITLSAGSVTIDQGSESTEFSVTAGAATGETTITATDAASGQTATADVVVGLVSDSDNENPNAAVRIVFSPDHVKMGAGETRDVVLLVKPPETPLSGDDVSLQVSGGLASAEIHRDLGNGVARYKVTITSKTGTTDTNGSVVATLPKVQGSGTAELVVVITGNGKKGK